MSFPLENNPNAVETLRDCIEWKLLPFNKPKYAYVVVNKKKPSDLFMISNYPDEWKNTYLSEKLYYIDPVAINAFKRISPFSWDENITLISDLKLTKIFELSKKYNIGNGYTFVLHDHEHNLATLSLLIDNAAESRAEEIAPKHRSALQMLLIEVHEKMLILNQNALSSSNDRKGGLPGEVRFTPRENAVLYWVGMGKTYPEIGIIIGISSRTVKFHMGNVIKKLGVVNSRQAVRLGVELGLITSMQSYRYRYG